ncbi:MAG: hypothetical protein DPW12_15525 [Rhodocyclaceae bacterium]|nr:hypothetical protein [Bacteroidia bacterium]MCQ3925547.1 hypothetical protein [Rhodocyclaceae bacterium]
MVFSIIFVLAALAYLLSSLGPDLSEARRERITENALAQAREALIGYALQYREQQIATGTTDAMYGYLPMPDVGTSRFHGSQPASCNTEGCAMQFINGAFPADTDTVIGRLPWKTLGLEPLRDGHGECLWYIVSANHKNLGISTTVRMNWDTLSHLDVVVASGGPALASALASAHERPVAIVFSPGPALPGQDRSNAASDAVTRCGGNYDVVNYLDPSVAAALGGVTNYLAGSTNNASGTTDATAPKGLSTQGRIYASGGNLVANACEGADCALLANDRGLGLGGDMLFGAIRKSAYFRTDINSMLDRMVGCLRDQPPASGTAARIADSTCYDASQAPRGYYDHYKEMVFLAKPSVPFTVNGDGTCAAALIFAGQRGAGQQRATAAQKLDFANYLEGANLANFSAAGTVFSGPATLERAPPQATEQDIVRCVPGTPSFAPVTSPTLGANQLVAYDTATRTLTLGRENITTTACWWCNANALFGCGWFSDVRAIGNGLRSYFNFQFMDVGGSVGFNGFVFALVDGLRNNLNVCGGGSSHLGYSGDNTVKPKILYPKIGVEFDQSRNFVLPTGFSESVDLNVPPPPGRKDPCGTTPSGPPPPDCAPPYPGYNSHAAIVFWGHEVANATDGVTRPNDDDNVHGFPTVGSIVGTRQPPRSHLDPATESGIKFVNLRGQASMPNNNSFIYHVRVELTPTRTTNADASLSKTAMLIEVWIDDDDDGLPSTLTPREAALKDTTRPMSLYMLTDPTFTPTLTQTADLYDVQESTNSCTYGASPAGCPAGQSCGSDNMCYRPALEKIQLGFTGSQRTSDQQVDIKDFFTTWLP